MENHGKSLSPHTNQYKNHQSRALSALSLSKVFSIIILLWSIDFWAPRASFSIAFTLTQKAVCMAGPTPSGASRPASCRRRDVLLPNDSSHTDWPIWFLQSYDNLESH